MFWRKHRKIYSFSVPIKKEPENNKIATHKIKIKFTDSMRLMSSSLSSLVDNLSEGLHNGKCTDYNPCLQYISTKDESFILNCLKCCNTINSILINI